EAPRLRVGKGFPDIGHGVREVVKARAAIGEELADHGIGTRRRDELQLGPADLQEGSDDPEVLVARTVCHTHAEVRRIQRDRALQVDYHDAYMVQLQYR